LCEGSRRRAVPGFEVPGLDRFFGVGGHPDAPRTRSLPNRYQLRRTGSRRAGKVSV
jgi:hypothetical protein